MKTILEVLRVLRSAQGSLEKMNVGEARELIGKAVESLEQGPWSYLEFDREMWDRDVRFMEYKVEEEAQAQAQKRIEEMRRRITEESNQRLETEVEARLAAIGGGP